MAGKGRRRSRSPERLTISLGAGQREALQAIADYNDATMAFVVRYALARFIADAENKQLKLDFPG